MDARSSGAQRYPRQRQSANEKSNYAPPITVCKLWVKVSAKGTRYLTGRMGGAKVLVMPNPDKQSPEDASHVLRFAQAAPMKPREPS